MHHLLLTLALLIATPAMAGLPVYPDAAFSRPAEDVLPVFDTLSGTMLAPGVEARAAAFENNELVLTNRDDLPGTRTAWCFRRKPGETSGTHLAIDERIRRAPSAVSVTITNDSPQDMPFALHAQEMPWEPCQENRAQAWVLGDTLTVPAGEQRTLRFDTTQPLPTVPDAPRARVLYPLSAVYLIPVDVQDDVAYRFLLENLTIHYPPATGLTVAGLGASRDTVHAGERISIEWAVSGDSALEGLSLECRRGDRTLWRVEPTVAERAALADNGTCVVTREVPWHLPTGRYTLGAVLDGYRVAGPEFALEIENGRRPGFPRVTREERGGVPVVAVDGESFPWVGYSSYEYQPGNVAQFADGRLTVACVPVAAGRHVHHHAGATTAVAHNFFDFGELEERVAFSLQGQPEARLMFRVSLGAPHYWMQLHPEAVARVRTPRGDLMHEETGARQVSLTDAGWRAYQAELLTALIDHCAAQPWADRLIGLWVTGGVTEEWFAWGCNEGFFADYSEPNQAAFAAWCEGRGLPWRAVPDPEERTLRGHDLYPPGSPAAAYARFASESTGETIEHFARVVKDASAGRLLAGALYGYVIQLAGEPRQHFSANFALRRVLDCPDLDFFAGIPLHNFRLLAGGYDTFVVPEESVAVAGKLFCNENDLFSWLHPILWWQPYDPADPRGAAISMHRRVAANDLVHGAQRQWFSLMSSWHDDDELQQEFSRQRDQAVQALELDRRAVEEVAFLVDDTTFAATPPGSTLLRYANVVLQRAAGTTGAPLRVWLLSDADKLPDRVRFVVVACASGATATDLAKLSALIEQGGRTVLVVGPAGLVNPDTWEWDLEAPGRLVGLPIVVDPAGGSGLLSTPLEDGPKELRPRAFVEGGSKLRYEDGPGAFAERPLADGGRLLWCGVPPVSRALLRAWMAEAGVFFYAPDGCQVTASQELVAVMSTTGGEVPLRWPTAVRVEDLYDGWTGRGTEMVCPFEVGQTRLFRVWREGP